MSSKRDLERKQREEQEATAHAFQEFINTFQDYSGPPNKTFVKSGVLYAKSDQDNEHDKGQIYNPKPLIKKNSSDIVKNAIECARLVKVQKIEKIRGQEKPKSNLELLKEELKQRHLERDERSKCKDAAAANLYQQQMYCSDDGDPNSTNLFVANLNLKVTTESDLMQLFGAYGPLASVKIMWPRGDEKGRNTNCGFVAFMCRKDASRALKQLKNRDDMRVGWGKAVELPNNPVYIPPELLKLSLPPPSSGLPFNAQPIKAYTKPATKEEMKNLLNSSVIRVTIPFDKKILMIVHRMIEFVVREGPLFEAIIMNQEINNPTFQFLFDNKNPVHIYYRWKLYSILQGESQKYWSTKKFRMFKGGSVWTPPFIPNYFEGMPECLTTKTEHVNRKYLSDAQKNRLIQFVQNLNLSRNKVAEAMIFCLNHSEAYNDIVDIIADSFENILTKPTKKIARLYLLSDVLYNSEMKKKHSSEFRKEFEKHLLNIFNNLQATYNNFKNTSDKEAFKSRVLKVLRSWDLWKFYNSTILNKLELIILGVSSDTNNDGDLSSDEYRNGSKLIKRSLKKQIDNNKSSKLHDANKLQTLPGFIPSRWETVDPEQVEAQAMSTKKFFDLEQQRNAKEKLEKVKKITEQEREQLRRIELMVMQYQVEIEIGKRKLKKGTSLEEDVDDYRNYLLNKLKKCTSSSSEEDKCSKSVTKHKEKDKRKSQKHRNR